MARTEDLIKKMAAEQEALEKSLREGTQPAAVSPTGATVPGAPAMGRFEATQPRRAPIVARSDESVDRDEERRREREARKQAERAQEDVEKETRKAAEKAAAAPPKLVLPPDMAQVVDYGKVYAASTISDSNLRVSVAAEDLGMTPERLKEVAAAQGVDLDDIYNARLKGRTYDEYVRAAKERGVSGFLTVEERERALPELAQEFDSSKAGIASDKPIELKQSGAGAQVILGTQKELPEVTKPGEHAYTLASVLVDSLLKQDRPSELYDLYGRKTATGATQQYVEDRVKDLVRSTNLRADTPNFDERMQALRRRAFNEVLAYKTIGMWMPVITSLDVEAVEGRRDPTLWEAATTPNIEIVGVNNKRQAVYRMESPLGVVMRTFDLPQSALVGAISGQGAARGVQTGANFLEFALDATEGQSGFVRVPAVAAGLAASIFAPDVLSTGAAALKGVRAVSQARRVAAVAPRAVELMEQVSNARAAGRFDDAAKAEVKLRNEFPAVADDLDRKDARMAESLDIIDPKADILNEDLASLLGSQIPLDSAREAAQYRPYLHPSRRRQVLQGATPTGQTASFPGYEDLFDTKKQLEAVRKAKTDYVTNGPKTVEEYAAARLRGAVRSVFASLPTDVASAVDIKDVEKLADDMAAQAALALNDPSKFADEAKKLIGTTIKGADDNSKAVRKAFYARRNAIAGKVDSLRGADIQALQTADLALFERMEKAVEANNEARGAAAALLRDQLAEDARIIVQPLNIFDKVAVKTPAGEPVRLTEGGHIFLFSLRKAAPNMDFKEAYSAAAMIDAVIRAQAMKRGIDPYELYKNIFPDLRKGTAHDLERFLKQMASKSPPPASSVPPSAVPFETSVSAEAALEATPPIPAGYTATDIEKVDAAKRLIKEALAGDIPEVLTRVVEPGTQKTVESLSVIVGDARIVIDRTPNVEEFNVIVTLGEGADRKVTTLTKVKGNQAALTKGEKALEARMNERVKAKKPAIVGAPVKTPAAAKAAPPTAPGAAPTPTPAAPAPAAVTPAPAVVQPAPAVTPAPPAPAPAVAARPTKLPKDLAGAKSRYNIGTNVYIPKFESDIDKALFIVAQTKKSKSHDKYMAFLRAATGLTDDEIVKQGQNVRAALKARFKVAEPGAYDIEQIYQPRAVARVPAPAAVPTPAPAAVPAAVPTPAPAAKPGVLPVLSDKLAERKEQLRQYLRENPSIPLRPLFGQFQLKADDVKKIHAEVKAERARKAVPAPAPAAAPTPAPIPAAGPPTPAPIAAAVEAQPEAAKIVEAPAPAKRKRATRVKAEVAAPEDAPEVKPVVEAMAETEKKFAEAQKKSAADAVARAEAVEKARQEKNAKKLAELEAQRKIRDAEKQKRLEAYQAEQVRLAEEKAKKLAEREAKAKAKAEEAAKRLAERQAKEAKKEAFRLALEAQRREESRLFVEAAERADAEKARRAQEAAALRAAEIEARRVARLAEIEAERAARAAKQAEREAEAARVAAEAQRKAAEAREALRTEYPQLADLEDRFPIARPANLKAVLREVRASTTNESYKRIIDRLLEQGGRFSNAEFRIVQAGDVVPSRVAQPMSNGASGTALTTFGGELVPHGVYIRGTSLGKIDFPLDEVILHEAIHAATVDQYEIGIRLSAKGTPTAAAAKAINELQGQVVRELKRRLETGGDLAGLSRGDIARMVDSPTELIAYGLTNPQFQTLLKTIKVESVKSAWTKFVEGVARLLGLAPGDESALSVLLERTERLMDLPPDELEATRRMVFPNSTPEATVSEMRSIADTAAYEEGKRFAAAEVAPTDVAQPAIFSSADEARRAAELARPAVLQSPEFTRWFGDSKVVDADGKPLVVYHGTAAQFDRFDRRFVRGQLGFHFGTLDQADARVGDATIMPVYLSIKNPLRVRDEGAWTTEAAIREINKASGLNIPYGASDERIVQELQRAGYDGIVYENRFEYVDDFEDSYIVFEPTQIKSAVSNTGEFDATDSSILKQVSPSGAVKGAVETLADGKTILYLFEGADASTIIHEAGHILRRSILDNEDMGSITNWIKSQGVNVSHEFGEFVGDAAEIEKAEELFAKAFERYAREGIVPPSAPLLKTIFETLKQALDNVYRVASDPVVAADLKPEVRAVFDKMFEGSTTTANPTILEKVRRTLLGGTGPGFEGILTTLSREVARKGIPGFTEEDIFRMVDDAKKAGVPSDRPILKFPTKVNGKKDWSADDLAEAQTNAEVAHLDREARRIGIRLDLTARGKGTSPAMIIEDKASEALRSVFAAVEGERGVKKGVRAVGRAVVGAFLGGDMVADKGGTWLRNMPPAFRAVLDGVERVVQMAIGDTITLVNSAIDTGKDDELIKYLVGRSGITRPSGRAILSAGHNHMDAVLGMFNGMFSKLSDDEITALQAMADAVNAADPGAAMAKVGFRADGSDFDAADAAAGKTRGTIVSAYNKTMNATQKTGESEFGATLAGALRNAVQATGSPRPSHEMKLMETLLYLTKKTSRNGAFFSGSDEDAVRMILGTVKSTFDDESSRRVAVLIGSFGGADQAKRMLVNMNLGISADAERNFKQWTLAESVDEKYKPEIQRVVDRYGFNPNFVADPVLGVNFYLPAAARERLANALARANYRETATVMTSAADAFNMMYRYMKLRMTRGSFVTKGRYFMMNTADHGAALGTIVGLGVGAASTARLLPQNLLVIPPLVGQVIDLPGRIPGSPIPRNLTERVRRGLQAAGDRGAWAVGQIFSTGKYRIQVNPILEGADGTFRAGGNVYNFRDVRNIAVEEGIFSSFDTSQLQALILKEGQLELSNTQLIRTPSLRAVPGSKTRATARLNNFFAELSDSVADLAEAWGERERLGAMVTLMEAGYSPRVAARLTIDALYDYAQTMTKNDRGFLVSVLFPFWAFQKNANMQVFNLIFSPAGAYRAMVIKRMKDRTADLASELLYDEVGSEYGVDVKSMPPELQDTYYSIMTAFYDAYEGNPPEDAKRAMRLILTGRSVGVEGGQYFETAYKLMEQRGAGAFADVNKFGQYVSLKPEKSARMSSFRDRTGISVPFPRTEAVRRVYAYLGDNHTYMEMYWPESAFEAGMKYHTQVLAAMALLGATGIEMVVPGTGMEEGGIEGVKLANVLEPVVSVERSPILGPLLPSLLPGMPQEALPPRRIAKPLSRAADAVVEIHPAIAKTLSDAYAVNFFRVPKDADPFMVSADGKLPQLTEEEQQRIRELNDKAPGIGIAKDERSYMVGGVMSTALYNSPLGELNDLLLRWEKEPLERADIRGEILSWAKFYGGVDVSVVSASKTMKAEEPEKLKESKKF